MKFFSKKTVIIGVLIALLLIFHGVQYLVAFHLGNRDGQITSPLFSFGVLMLDSMIYALLVLTSLFSNLMDDSKHLQKSLLQKTGSHPEHMFLPGLIGIVCSVSIGCLEVVILMLTVPSSEFDTLQSILLPLASSAGFFFLGYITSWFLIVCWVQRFFHLKRFPVMAALASFWMIVFIYTTLNRSIDILNSLPDLYNLCFLMILSALSSIAVYLFLISIEQSRFNLLISFGVLPSLISLEMLFWTWMKKASILPETSILFPLLFAVLLILSVEIFWRIRGRINTLRLLALLFVGILLSPVIASKMVKNSSPLSADFSEGSHSIKHVIVITDDTLRPDFLSCYGSERVHTPHIDRLAQDGVLFKNTFSAAPWTMPSVASIMTGLSPAVHGTKTKSSRLPDAIPTLAEYMYDEGYYTSAIGRNGILTSKFNFSQGFLEYHFFPKAQNHHIRGIKLFQWLFPEQFRTDVSTRDITASAIGWISSHHTQDFFLWLHYFDPHQPYTPPDGLLPKKKIVPSIGKDFSELQAVRGGYLVPSLQEREWIKELYAAEVRHVDNNIGELIAVLKELNMYDNSLIVFTSDHGEEFWEHGGFEHGHTLYNEVLRVPLIIKPPTKLGLSPQKADRSVSLEAILPTVLTLCEIPYETNEYQAKSLAPFSQFASGIPAAPLVSSSLLYYEEREAVIFDGMKYVRTLLTNNEELYDLTRDPGEQKSVMSEFPEKVLRAQNIMSEHEMAAETQKEYYKLSETETFDLDEDTIQELKSLGYVH